MRTAPIRRRLTTVLLLINLAAAAQYGEQPLRGNLGDRPYLHTELGREGHRFAGASVNQYRIYDFYARQAAYHLAHPEDSPALMPPFPGLDGGRRGHWGGTNEPATTALRREIPMPFATLTSRSAAGRHYLRSGTLDHPAVMVFDTGRMGLMDVLLDAKMTAPGNHLLQHQVDIYGFSLKADGTSWLKGAAQEWTAPDADSSIARHDGYYLHGDQVVYRTILRDSAILDQPQVAYVNGTAVCIRSFEWLDTASALSFHLPLAAAAATTGPTTQRPLPKGATLLSTPLPVGQLHHLILPISNDTLAIEISPDKMSVAVTGAGPHDRLQILTWLAGDPADGDLLARLSHLPLPVPSTLTQGGPGRFTATLAVRGVLNADPAASGTPYEIDDIPVPADNPYQAPMTLSGIAFDPQGAAYICTLTGDVWRVTGLNGDLAHVSWKRYAAGLYQPMGLEVIDGKVCVSTLDQIVRLHDLNGDQEADFIERLNKIPIPFGGQGRNELERDSSGNLYFSCGSGIYRLSPDGRTISRIGGGARNPLGLGLRPDGLALSDSSEGDSQNGTCTIFESDHPENAQSPAKRKRILYVPRGIDNSPGSRLFVNEPRFGPLGSSLIGLSYGTGSWYVLLRDANDGTPQAALLPMPGEFASGALRLRTNPVDGQIYLVGLDGWGDYAVAEGCLHRIRYTGKEALLPTAWQAHRNGLLIRFSEALDPKTLNPAGFLVQQWNNIDSPHTYGSADYSVREPGKIGHDRLAVTSVTLQADEKSLFIEIPELLPAMSTHVFAALQAASGRSANLNLYATINSMRADAPGATPARADKQTVLKVPEQDNNGNTYQNMVEYFDKAAGRTLIARAAAAETAWTKADLDYAWLKTNLLEKQCFPCHAAGTPIDYTAYPNLLARVNLESPEKSHLLGMLSTNSMPPFPLPTVAPRMKEAVLEWIRMGAPQERQQQFPTTADIAVSGEWTGRPELAKAHVNDGNFATIWAGPKDSRNGWVILDLGQERTISAIELDEGPYHRTRNFALQAQIAGQWQPLATGTRIGNHKRIAIAPTRARIFRVIIDDAIDVPTLAEVQLFGPVQQ